MSLPNYLLIAMEQQHSLFLEVRRSVCENKYTYNIKIVSPSKDTLPTGMVVKTSQNLRIWHLQAT